LGRNEGEGLIFYWTSLFMKSEAVQNDRFDGSSFLESFDTHLAVNAVWDVDGSFNGEMLP